MNNVVLRGIENKLMLTSSLNQRKNMYSKIPESYWFVYLVKTYISTFPVLSWLCVGWNRDCFTVGWPPQPFGTDFNG